MMDRQNGKILFECDDCPDVLETGESDFGEAWDMAKSDGWRTRKFGNVWKHRCPKCSEVRR